MFKKTVFTAVLVLISFCTTAQNGLNSYKYIIIPEKFEFSKVEDQYQLNSLTKFLFNKYGYDAYFVEDDFPEDLKNDRCMALTAEASNEKSGMFKTKLEMVLKDCFGKVVMTSEIGESRLKKIDRAYNEALRDAFETFQNLDYDYKPKDNSNKVVTAKTEIVEKQEEVNVDKTEVIEKKVEVKYISSKENNISINQSTEAIYYAQARENGYQLVDSEPKIVMILLNTTAKDVFMVKDKNAIIYKENEKWIYFENNGAELRKVINIKF